MKVSLGFITNPEPGAIYMWVKYADRISASYTVSTGIACSL